MNSISRDCIFIPQPSVHDEAKSQSRFDIESCNSVGRSVAHVPHVHG